MIDRRIQLILLLLMAAFLLGACDQIDDLSERADVSQIEEAEFYSEFQNTVEQVRIPVLFVGLVTLLGGWKLGRFGLAINGFVIGGLIIYTYLSKGDFITDENTIRGMGVVGGVLVGILAYFLYNLMALVIGGAIGTTLMGGAWLQVADNVPPQLLVFLTTFVSAMVMFVVFRLFLVAFSAVIGATLLMLGVPLETVWVIPLAVVGLVIQSGIAWWIGDDIFSNLRGDLRAAVGESFAEVLGPFGVLRERQRESVPSGALEPRTRAPKAQAPAAPQQQYSAPPQPQYRQPPPQQAPPAQQQHVQPPPPQRYSPPPPQPYSPPPQQAYSPPPQQSAPSPQPYTPPPQQQYTPSQSSQPEPPPPAQSSQDALQQTQQHTRFSPENLQIVLSDGRTFPLEGFQITVGRHADNTIQVDDPQVSGHHMVFSIQPEGVVVWDTNSTNGTRLNGSMLTGSHRLTTEDVVQIGEVTLRMVKRSDLESNQAPTIYSNPGGS